MQFVVMNGDFGLENIAVKGYLEEIFTYFTRLNQLSNLNLRLSFDRCTIDWNNFISYLDDQYQGEAEKFLEKNLQQGFHLLMQDCYRIFVQYTHKDNWESHRQY